MKRSEALNLIDGLLEKYELADGMACEEILEALEAAGLYPPCRRDGRLEWEPETHDHKSN